MKQILYASTASHAMTETELLELLKQARKRNKANDVTGIMLYHKGYFVQLLEGDADAVDTIYQSISKDKRHHNVNLIGSYDIQERSFGEWNMGFKEISRQNIESIDGFSDIFLKQNGKSELLKRPTILVEMLATLFQINS